MARWLLNIAGSLLLISLLYAPWALGCTRPGAIQGLELLLGLIIAFWLGSLVLERISPAPHVPADEDFHSPLSLRQDPRFNPTDGRTEMGSPLNGERFRRVALCCILFLLAQGWWMSFNAHSFYSPVTHRISPLKAPVPTMPGSADRLVSSDWMLRLIGLLAVLLFVSDLARHKVWRRRIAWTVAAAGASISLLGIVQKIGPLNLTGPMMEKNEGRFFATFNYHGNAGAFLNLVIPIAFGLSVIGWQSGRTLPKRILPGVLLALSAAGELACGSKAGVGITILILGGMGFWTWRSVAPEIVLRPASPGFRSAAMTAAMLLLAAMCAVGLRFEHRWSELPGELGLHASRGIAFRVGLPMALDAGPWGNGPGTFKILFPHSPHFLPEIYARWIVSDYIPGRRISMWSNIHEDYIQATIEWGFVGAALGGILLFGGMFRLWQGSRQTAGFSISDRIFLFSAFAALLGISLHALVDFPFEVASLELYAVVYLGVAFAV